MDWCRSLAGGPRDYQGFWHRITKAHPLLSYSRIPRFQESRVTTLPQKHMGGILQGALNPRQGADAALQIRTLPDTTLLMLFASRTSLRNVFSSQQLGTGTPLSKGSQAAHTSCVEGEEDFVFGHSSPFNGLMDKITDAW